MREFFTAVQEGPTEVDESTQTVIALDGEELVFNEPVSGQLAIMMSMGSRKLDMAAAGDFIHLFIELADEDTQRLLRQRLLDRNDTFDLESEGGIFDLWEGLTEEWSARPTKQPRDYQPPRRATGSSSTAPTRVKASTSSASRSTASSTSSTRGARTGSRKRTESAGS